MENDWVVYMIRCGDGSLYTGITNNLLRRFSEHCMGKGAKYTRGRGPLVIVFSKEVGGKSDALREELRIKKLPKKKKEALVPLDIQALNLL